MTATFNTRVERDVSSVIAFDKVVKGTFYRENLAIRVIPVKNDHVKKVWLADFADETRNVLVFCLSCANCQELVLYLKAKAKVSVDYYFAKRENGSEVLNQFVSGGIRILVATFDSIGAGFNKTDIHDVVWMYTPSSIVDFYQGIGRAGRDDAIVAAKGYLLTSKAWRKDEWLEILVIIGNMLKDLSIRECLVSDLVERLEVRFRPHNKSASIEFAIGHGVDKGYFIQSMKEDGKEYLSLTSSTSELDYKQLYLDSRANEVSDMSKLNQNLCCCWKLVIEKLNGEVPEGWRCRTCSFEGCQPDGDLQPDYSTAGEVCYLSELGGIEVYALGKGNEMVSFNSYVIRNICLRFLPDIRNTPPEWAVTFIPDSSGDNEKNIGSIAECLNGLSVVKFITINPSYQHLKMFEAKTDEEKDYVLQKYVFDLNQLLGVRKLLIYDDCINTGKTIMNAILMIRQTNVSEVCILVNTIYERKSPSRTISQIDLWNSSRDD